MKKLETMKFDSWGETFTACLRVGRYMYEDRLAIEVLTLDDGFFEPFSSLTVCLPEYKTEENCAFIDVNNFSKAEELVNNYHLGTKTGRIGISGYCAYPEYRFDLDMVRKYECEMPLGEFEHNKHSSQER